MARTSKRRLLEGLLNPPGDMSAGDQPRTPRWIAQRDEIIAAGVWGDQVVAPLFDRFELLDTLGHGGYGCVFKARDPELDRIVAIKRCKGENRLAAELLLKEARLIARLTHDNIITVYEVGRDGDDVFFVMEYVGGGSLHQFACRKHEPPRSWRELVPIFAGAARGLAAAHARGVVHGDFKPANVLLHEDKRRPLVADFGLARMIGAPSLMPDTVGTLAFTAREVLAGGVPDERSDQWSFFVALWCCLEGKLPFNNPAGDESREFWSSEEAVIRAIDAWHGPSSLGVDGPEQLRELLRVGLSLDPAERWPNMDVVARKLADLAVLAEAPVLATSSEQSTTRPIQGWRLPLLGSLFLTAGVLAMLRPSYFPQSASADRGQSEPGPPCVADGIPLKPDTSIESVCRALKADYEAAAGLWVELSTARENQAETPQQWIELAYNTAILAQTLLAMADEAEAERATTLRAVAGNWVLVAQDYLVEARLLDRDGDETAEAVSYIQPIADKVLDQGTE